MDSMKSWAGIEEEKAGRSVCCVMQSVRVLVVCCGIVLHVLVVAWARVPHWSCWHSCDVMLEGRRPEGLT